MEKNPISIIFQLYEDLKRRFFEGRLTKGLLIIGSGVAIAQIITAIISPLLTRLYTPSDFGVLAVFNSTLAIIVIAGGLRYDATFPLPREDIDAANLFMLFFVILSVSTFFLIIIIVLFGDLFFSLFHAENLHPYYFLLIVGFFGAGIYRALTYWASRRKDYPRITYTKINQSVAGAVGKLFLGFLSFGGLGLVIGAVISQCMGITTLLREMWLKDRHLFDQVSLKKMRTVGREYHQFPLYSFPAAILNTIALSAPVLFLSSIYGLEVAGYYGLAYSLIVMPGSLISQSLAQVYYAEVSHMMRENSPDLLKLFKDTTKKLLIIGIPIIGGISLIAPFIFPIIFGGRWTDAGYYCLPLSLMVIGGFVMSATTNLGVYGFNHWTLIYDFTRTTLVFLGFYLIAIFSLPIMEGLLIYSSIMAGMYYVIYLMNIAAIKRLNVTKS